MHRAKQDRALALIRSGAARTTRDIATAMGYLSIQGAQSVVRQLERRGLVRRVGRSEETHRIGLGVYAARARSNSVIYAACVPDESDVYRKRR